MSTSRMLAISFSMAVGATGSATADERASFTDRVQQSQGIAHVGGARMEQAPATTEAAAAGEAASFIARVVASQGISPSRPATREAYGAPVITGEATSFITRVMASQGIGPVGADQGSAAGEPDTR